ncbi:MAG: hypothetical protein ACJAZX_001290 [Rickettsiales bacterium]|jgi:hypothetical protein
MYEDQDLHPQSIRKWIKKEGLKAFLHERDYYIYGAIWKEFLTNRNQKNKAKRGLDFNQFKCFKCKSKQPPLNNIITKLTTGFNDCIKAFGVCQKCGDDELKRPYKRLELDQIKEIFEIKLDELPTLCNSSTSTNKTHSNNSQKVGVSESSDIIKNKDKPVEFKAPNETRQLTLFDFIN